MDESSVIKRIRERFLKTGPSKGATILIVIGAMTGMMFAGSLFGQPVKSYEKSFNPEQLAEYDGTDPSRPIYLAFEGYVYDVSSGRQYYAPGGSYHFLAGKDATDDLLIAGGDIIKRKYSIIGIYTER